MVKLYFRRQRSIISSRKGHFGVLSVRQKTSGKWIERILDLMQSLGERKQEDSELTQQIRHIMEYRYFGKEKLWKIK